MWQRPLGHGGPFQEATNLPPHNQPQQMPVATNHKDQRNKAMNSQTPLLSLRLTLSVVTREQFRHSQSREEATNPAFEKVEPLIYELAKSNSPT
jgi:hypothetical protein